MVNILLYDKSLTAANLLKSHHFHKDEYIGINASFLSF